MLLTAIAIVSIWTIIPFAYIVTFLSHFSPNELKVAYGVPHFILAVTMYHSLG